MARRIEVEIVGDSRSLQRALGRAGQSGGKFGKVMGGVLRGGAVAAGAAFAGLAVAAKIGFDEFNQGQKVAAQTRAVIKSTGKAANVSAKQVENLAEALMKKSGVDDEVIQSGENMLLTFKQIRNEAGKGNDIFRQATEATLDMAVAMGKDMPDAALIVGKALNDPIRGLSALRRVGVQFTDGQEKAIKKMVEMGDVAGAQKVILEELREEFGGSAEAAGDTFAGQINVLRESFNNWAGDMVAKVMPAIQDFVDRLNRARGFKAKLKIVWTGVREAARSAMKALRTAIFGETTRTPLKLDSGKIIDWKTTRQVGLVKSIQDGLRNVDWSSVGKRIGEGISSRVRITADFIANALKTANAFIDSHINEFAEVGAKMFAAIVGKLLDPIFWARNWQLALGIAAAVIPIGKAGMLGGRLALLALRPFGRLLGPGLARITARAVDAMLSIFGRLPDRLGRIALSAALATLPGLGRIVAFFFGPLRNVLARIPGWLKAAFRLSFWLALVSAIRSGLERIRSATQSAIDFMRRQWGRISGPVNAFISLLREIWGWLRTITRHPWTIVLKIPRPNVPDPGGGVPFVPGIASGGDIARSGLAMVHRGERVLPARVVNRGGSHGGGNVRVIVVGGDRGGIEWLQSLDTTYRRGNGGRGILG